MPVAHISRDICDGCGICVDYCPNDVFRLDKDNKAIIAYGGDCHTCFTCENDCPVKAIEVSAVVDHFPLPLEPIS